MQRHLLDFTGPLHEPHQFMNPLSRSPFVVNRHQANLVAIWHNAVRFPLIGRAIYDDIAFFTRKVSQVKFPGKTGLVNNPVGQKHAYKMLVVLINQISQEAEPIRRPRDLHRR